MKKLLFAILLGALFVSCSKVPAGNVGIKFYLLGKDKGVDYEALGPGRYWIGINEELFLFPTQRQNKVWSDDEEGNRGFEFQSKEGMKLSANVGIEYQIEEVNVPRVFEMYKKDAKKYLTSFLGMPSVMHLTKHLPPEQQNKCMVKVRSVLLKK